MMLQKVIFQRRFFRFLLFLYVVSIGFQNLINLPITGNKVQLPEFIFPFLLIFFPYSIFSSINLSKRQKALLMAILAMIVSNMLSFSVTGNGLLEVAGKVYLALIFAVFTFYFISLSESEFVSFVINSFFAMGSILAAVSLAGYLFAVAGWENRFVYKINEYPYLGTLFRLCGPTFTPTMIITLLICSLFFSITNYDSVHLSRSMKNIFLLLMTIACILTFSKSILLLCLGWWIIFLRQKKLLSTQLFLISTALTVLVLTISTHFLFVNNTKSNLAKYESTPFTSNKKTISIRKIDVIETTYLTLKRTALSAFTEKPIFGIGPGSFNDFVVDQKTKGNFPKRIPEYDPHSTYTGAMAETGVLGLTSVIFFLILIIKDYSKIKLVQKDSFRLSIFLLLLFFIIEGISTDIMNFRHLWIVLAVSFVYFDKKKLNNKTFGI